MASYLVTRRCFDRRFLLRPSPLLTELFEYVLAVKARKYGIQLHAYCVLSNHWHCVLTDPLGRLPEFQRDLGSTLARALNAAHGRWEFFWAPGSYSAVALQTADDLLDKMAYVLANPASAGLVRRGVEWPGPWTAPDRIGAGPRLVMRPEHYFRKDGPTPPSAMLELTCPDGFTVEGLRSRLGEELARREDQAARARALAGQGVMGPKKVLAQRPLARPVPGEARRGLRPRVASRDSWRRVEALGRLRAFHQQYRAAWRAFVGGARGAIFPEGTYWMRVNCGVACTSSG